LLWADGYLHTNDIGVIDSDGYLQITDRLKDVIKTGGEWVSSIEIEDLVMLHPAVAEAAVIGVRDDSGVSAHWRSSRSRRTRWRTPKRFAATWRDS
jgi:acyl-CoA synthetase (AMP-forming)/AMP-acid ligase II